MRLSLGPAFDITPYENDGNEGFTSPPIFILFLRFMLLTRYHFNYKKLSPDSELLFNLPFFCLLLKSLFSFSIIIEVSAAGTPAVLLN